MFDIIKRTVKRFAHKPANPKDDIVFKSNGLLTLGVEVELQLINPQGFGLLPRAEELLAACAHIPAIKPEFYLSTIEANTAKCNDVHEIATDLKQSLDSLRSIGQEMGIAFSTTGAHPFAKYSDCIISPSDRYQELIDRNQWLTRRMTVYGLHVHIGMASGDDCIRFNNFFIHFLPHLLALSASSPFWQGTDTGLSSCRPTTYEALPTAGQPYQVRNWKDFENLYESLTLCGSIKSIKDLWWDLRPSPHYGTLEIRVCDGCATLQETLAIVSFIHSLAHWFTEHGSWLESVSYPPQWLARENKWRAIRYGLDAELVVNVDGKVKSLRDDLEEWLEKINPYVVKLGYTQFLSGIRAIMDKGNSSHRQRACFQQTESLEGVVQLTVDEFNQGYPIW